MNLQLFIKVYFSLYKSLRDTQPNLEADQCEYIETHSHQMNNNASDAIMPDAMLVNSIIRNYLKDEIIRV